MVHNSMVVALNNVQQVTFVFHKIFYQIDFGVYISTTKIVFRVEEFSKHVKVYIQALRPNLKFNDLIICGKV